MQPLKIVQRPTPPPRLPPVEDGRQNSISTSAAGLSARPDTQGTRRKTMPGTRSHAPHAAGGERQQGEQHAASALEEVSVEGCLEYLTRPHTSWGSAVKIQETLRERVEEQKLNILTRSMLASRRSSFMERCAAGTARSMSHGARSEGGDDGLSICSAPAGFPRRGHNASRSCTGTLRKGRLVSPYTTLSTSNTSNHTQANTSHRNEAVVQAMQVTSGAHHNNINNNNNGTSNTSNSNNTAFDASLTVSSSSLTSSAWATTMRSSVSSHVGRRGTRPSPSVGRAAEAELMIVGAAHQNRERAGMPPLIPLPQVPHTSPLQTHSRPMLARPARVAPMLPPR